MAADACSREIEGRSRARRVEQGHASWDMGGTEPRMHRQGGRVLGNEKQAGFVQPLQVSSVVRFLQYFAAVKNWVAGAVRVCANGMGAWTSVVLALREARPV